MRRALILMLLVASACAMPVEGVGAEVDGAALRMELERGEDGLVSGVRLVNDGVEELRFGPSSRGYRTNPRVFVEAQQADGEYVGQGRLYLDAAEDRVDSSSLPPGGVLSFPVVYGLRPGDYRVSLEVYGAEDAVRRVSRELGRTGWPVELVDEAVALQGEAEAASCTGLARTIQTRLLRSADADGIETLESAWGDGRLVRQEMLRRGGFVRELAEFVRVAPLEQVDDLVESLARRSPDEQAPVQRAANERLLESVENVSAELLHYRLASLGRMYENWPESAAETLLWRLERGDERGYTLSSLIRLFIIAQERFDAMRPAVYAALRRRCEGARGPVLAPSCELALSVYDPDGDGLVGLGGFATSCGCGGAFSGGSHCAPLRERWRALEASAPTPEDYALPSRVEDIAPEDSLEFD